MYDGALQDLIDELGNLPGIGPKSAQRIAFHLLTSESEDIERLVAALSTVQANVNFCTVCGNVTQAQVCRICADVRRDRTVVCVVEESKDIVAIERTNEFKGTYHVLGGNLNPMAGRGAEMLRIRELMMRLGDGVITEVIIATNPNLEGEATASYLSRQLRAFDLIPTRQPPRAVRPQSPRQLWWSPRSMSPTLRSLVLSSRVLSSQRVMSSLRGRAWSRTRCSTVVRQPCRTSCPRT